MDWFPVLLLLHVLGVVVWVGGMFFAYVCLRPVAASQLAPPERLRLWRAVLGRFFSWVGAAVVLIPASGMATLAAIGMASAPLRWHLMMTSGLLMIAIFLFAVAVPYRALVRAVDAEDWPAGGKALANIRRLVALNLVLGFVTIGFATVGRLIG